MLICTSGCKNDMKTKRYGSGIFAQKNFTSFAIIRRFFFILTRILSVLLTPELGTSPKIVNPITLLKSTLNPDIASIMSAKMIKLHLPINIPESASRRRKTCWRAHVTTFWKKTALDGCVTFRCVTRHAIANL